MCQLSLNLHYLIKFINQHDLLVLFCFGWWVCELEPLLPVTLTIHVMSSRIDLHEVFRTDFVERCDEKRLCRVAKTNGDTSKTHINSNDFRIRVGVGI